MAIKKPLERSVEMTGIDLKEESKPFERFSFDTERERVWSEIFDVLNFFTKIKKASYQDLKNNFPNCSRINSILTNLSNRDEAFIVLKKKKDCWYFIGKIEND